MVLGLVFESLLIVLCVSCCVGLPLPDGEYGTNTSPPVSRCDACDVYEIQASRYSQSFPTKLWTHLTGEKKSARVNIGEVEEQVSDRMFSSKMFTANVPVLFVRTGQIDDSDLVPSFSISYESAVFDKHCDAQDTEDKPWPMQTVPQKQPALLILEEDDEESDEETEIFEDEVHKPGELTNNVAKVGNADGQSRNLTHSFEIINDDDLDDDDNKVEKYSKDYETIFESPDDITAVAILEGESEDFYLSDSILVTRDGEVIQGKKEGRDIKVSQLEDCTILDVYEDEETIHKEKHKRPSTIASSLIPEVFKIKSNSVTVEHLSN